MIQPSMEDVMALLGGSLGEDENQKQRLREFLEKGKWQPAHFESWMIECIEKGSNQANFWYYALQDVVVAVGSRLGFEVEFGHYRGSREEISFDGIWRRSTGEVILIEVKASGWPVTSVGQLGSYVERFASIQEKSPSEVYGLYIVGDTNVQHLIDQIKGGDYRNVLRLISFTDLVDLWRLREDLDSVGGTDSGAEKVQRILLPIESVNVGNIIELLMEIAQLKSAAAVADLIEDEEITKVSDDKNISWDKQELYTFLERNTDYQNAFLIALTLSEDDIIPTNQLLLLINKIAAVNFPSVGDQPLIKIAGLRSGFTMRRVNKDDFIISYERYEGKDKIIRYSIDPQYKDWFKDWVEQKGWILEQV